jgi:hypothetical protein
MANAMGPVFTGGFEEFVINDEAGEEYTLSFLPDRNNDELQQARQQPVFYYLPEQVRIARKGDKGDFKFRHIHFVGVFDESSVGIQAGETQGGVISFTVTSRYPTSVLKQAQAQILQRFSGKNDKYWGIRTNVAPAIKIAPITSNVTAVSNLAPGPDGSVPADTAGGGALPGGGAPGPGGEAAPGGPRALRAVMRGGDPWEPVPHGRAFRPSLALNPWAWKLDGQGNGSITGGENAYAGLLGPIPSEIMWAGFHGAYSTVVVTQNLMLPMWSQLMRVKITGDWKRIFEHFSAAANASFLWFSADIKAEFNNLRINGGIKVEVDIDGTMPGGQEMEKAINQRIDMIVQQFTEQAKKVIFDPPKPEVKPAEAPSGGFFASIFGGGGLALKFRRDETQLNLNYEETRYFRYLQPHTISSTLEGFYNEIKRDPQAEQKYFMRLVLGGLGRKITRLCKPVVNWPDPTKNWVGEPVAFLSTQVGYPDEHGSIQWKAQTFQKSDPPDTTFRPVWVERKMNEVSPPPPDWSPDKTYVKRKVHMLEPPGENAYPFTKVYVEQNNVELDPGPEGTLTNDNILEVRADEVGTLDVGPVGLAAMLSSTAEVIEVEFRAKGNRIDGADRMGQSSRFRWSFGDQDEPRFWRIFTGQASFVPAYQYRVHVTVKGTIFAKGDAWSGPWTEGSGNGALMVEVPGPNDNGVVKRALTMREIFSDTMTRAVDGIPLEAPGMPAQAPSVPSPAAPSVGQAPQQPVMPPRTDTGLVAPPPSGGNGMQAPTAPRAGVAPPNGPDQTVGGYKVQPPERPRTPQTPEMPRKEGGRNPPAKESRPQYKEDPGDWVDASTFEAGAAASNPSEQRTARSKNGRSQNEVNGPMREPDPGDWVEQPDRR